MDSKLKYFIHRRGYVRRNVTIVCNDIQEKFGDFSRTDKLQLLSKLKTQSQDLKEYDEKILEILWDSERSDSDNEVEMNKELDSCSSYTDKINHAIGVLEQSLQSSSSEAQVISQGGDSDSDMLVKRLKPRSVPLPTFGGEKGESLSRFFQNFEAAISRVNYSVYEKYLLLKENLSGRALILVDSLEQSNQSYSAAKQLLEKAFASPILQKFETVERLLDLKLPFNKDPFVYVSEIRTLKESVAFLKIDVNFMLQFFFWRSMNDTLKEIFIQITNSNYPSLQQIEDNLFLAIERYQMVISKRKSTPASNNPSGFNHSHYNVKERSQVKTSNYAVSVDVDKTKEKMPSKDARSDLKSKCTLCSNNHPYFRCDIYKTPREKLLRLREVGGCERCAYVNHHTSECRLDNLKCKLCGGAHFPVLCEKVLGDKAVKNKKSQGNGNKNCRSDMGKVTSGTNVHSNVICTTQALQAESDVGLALPTLTCRINDKQVRLVKDTGSQSNIISEDLVDACKLKVLKDNVNLKINGFNATKTYIAKIVEVPLKFGENLITVRAVSVPDIKISLKLPQLGKVVGKLIEANFDLADKLLDVNSTSLSDIKFVLGTESSHCVPVSTITLGPNSESALTDTPYGVLIEGNLNRLLEDLDLWMHKDTVKGLVSEMNSDSNISLPEFKEIHTNFVIFDEDGNIDDRDLLKATDEALENQCSTYLNRDYYVVSEDETELNRQLASFVFESTKRLDDGRLQMPILWNSKVDHLLGQNFNLAKSVLKSNFRKLSKDKEKLLLTDNVFKEQLELGIIEEVDDLDQFRVEYPSCSFLPHMSVFKLDRNTTKCRVVYLSNLCESDKSKPTTLCHNQVIHPGPNLNGKLLISMMLLRFDKYLLCFDISRAFLNIALSETDQARLLLLWYKDVSKENYSVTAFKAKRLPFGISCSPSILMMALYKILILDDDHSDHELTEMKKLVYSMFYMDNGSYSSNDIEDLRWARENIEQLFSGYCFNLQQWVTNDVDLQAEIDEAAEPTKDDVKLFGLRWNRVEDTLSTKPLYLEPSASTKRLILKSLASNFDLFGFQTPMLNRAKLFLHSLQCDKSVTWDANLSSDRLREWQLIARQVNSSPTISFKRFVGRRDGHYRLICFTDASKLMYGNVIYIQSLDTLETSFLYARNKIINRQLEVKSIPSLELNAVVFGLETLMDVYAELTGDNLVCPLRITELELYCDSMVAISWIEASVNLNRNLSKLSIFIKNRIKRINDLCEKHSVSFKFVPGLENPADQVSRAVSYKQLMKSNYVSGPVFLSENPIPGMHVVVVPCPMHAVEQVEEQTTVMVQNAYEHIPEHLIDLDRFSSFRRLVRVHRYVLKFVNKLISKVKCRDPNRCRQNVVKKDETLFAEARLKIIATEQQHCFPDCVNYFSGQRKSMSNVPNLVKQLNLFKDAAGIIRVKSKFGKRNFGRRVGEPILLSKSSKLSKLIILDLHARMNHAGKYALLSEIRKQFYIPQFFSTVKQILRNCTVCRRLNDRSVQINQSPYRDFRVDPPSVPFRYVYLDHFGPYNVKLKGEKRKVYVLIITCLWSRGVNLKICLDLSVKDFLRGFQMHVHEYGIPAKVFSDMGSSIVSGTNIIKDFLKDFETQTYLQENGIGEFSYTQYYKGNPALGGLVESLVKVSKRLIYGTLRNNVLDYFDFEFIISDVRHLINKRPVAFKEAVRDNMEDVPTPITPELLIRGFDLPTINCIPDLQPVDELDPEWNPESVGNIRANYEKLCKVRKNLLDVYQDEFLAQLVFQATDQKDRYKPVSHKKLSVGDIVLLKEKYMKPNRYPLGLVKNIVVNVNDEVTGVTVKKGTGELVKRHVSSLVPLLQFEESTSEAESLVSPGNSGSLTKCKHQPRRAAVEASRKMKDSY